MEGELWPIVYRLIWEESKHHYEKRAVFCDAFILTVFMWALIHDRPICWACKPRNWPEKERWRNFPAPSTMSDRLKTFSFRQLLQALLDRMRAIGTPAPVLTLDSKPLVVGVFSKDRDARRGQAGDGKARGYKMFCSWGPGVVPDVWLLGPMNLSDPEAGVKLVPQMSHCLYVLGDANHDSNPLHAVCTACGVQLLAPRKKPQTGLGHRDHEPGRLRSILMMESPLRNGKGPADFAKALYAMRGDIERRYGNMCSFGAGLQSLPSWVRTPKRVALWIAGKLIINGVRQCEKQGLAA